MSKELKPCPFCGSISVDVQAFRHGSDCYTVRCDGCGSLGPLKRSSAGSDASWDLAMEAWNTRHIPEGYALVPIKPTREMREAFHDSYEDYENGDASCPDAQWKAMIAAAQDRPE